MLISLLHWNKSLAGDNKAIKIKEIKGERKKGKKERKEIIVNWNQNQNINKIIIEE